MQKGKERYAEILKQVEKGREDVEKCKAFETKFWEKQHAKHGVTGNTPQENKRNKWRRMAVEDEAPKIELLPSDYLCVYPLILKHALVDTRKKWGYRKGNLLPTNILFRRYSWCS
jgi:hypothetical protein